MEKKYITKNFKQTQKLGGILAKEILSFPKKQRATILVLFGNLGGGKTTFLQGFAKGLGLKDKILSPTFVIFKKFQFQKTKKLKFKNFYHFDCYRIRKPDEILELEFKEIIKNPENIVAIEWPEKIKKFLPKEAIKMDFKHIDENTREIFLSF